MNKRAIIPNIFTIGNLFLGFTALLMISREQYIPACWLIIMAAILDGLDGLIARLVRSDSRFGAEIDSLVDVVSFGVIPSLLIYKVFFHTFGFIGSLIAFLPLLAGAIRLARFNTMLQTKTNYRGFQGLPIPSSALTLVAFNLYMHAVPGGIADQRLWLSLVLAVSLLMVSPIPYRRMPVIIIRGSRHPVLVAIFWVTILTAFIAKPALTLFPLMLIYVMTGPIEWGLKQLKKIRPTLDDENLQGTPVAPHGRTGRRFPWNRK